jgi:hypothetical protein
LLSAVIVVRLGFRDPGDDCAAALCGLNRSGVDPGPGKNLGPYLPLRLTRRLVLAEILPDAYSFPPPCRCCGPGGRFLGDVTPLLEQDWDLILAFPPCTYLTASAEWAYKDPDFHRYPGIGYHQRLNPGTLTGQARRQARASALAFVQRIWNSCGKICIENPIGYLSNAFRKPSQIIQPWHHGHPESKSTGLFLKALPLLQPTNILAIEEHGWRTPSGTYRWMNQTSGGQSNLSPSPDRDKIRSTTYAGIGAAMALQWGGDLT